MLRLKLVTEVQVDALIRVLQLFEVTGVVPLRVCAQRIPAEGTPSEVLEMEIDLATADLAPVSIRLIATKIKRLPMVQTLVILDEG